MPPKNKGAYGGGEAPSKRIFRLLKGKRYQGQNTHASTRGKYIRPRREMYCSSLDLPCLHHRSHPLMCPQKLIAVKFEIKFAVSISGFLQYLLHRQNWVMKVLPGHAVNDNGEAPLEVRPHWRIIGNYQ